MARPKARGVATLRAHAIGRVAAQSGERPVIPLVVLAEVYRGDAADAAVDRFVHSAAQMR
jgi:hypothetical protein